MNYYGLPSYKQKHAQWLAAEQKQRVHERSSENKRKLADKIDDNEMLIRQHLKAIRRLLGIGYIKASTLARRKHKPYGVVAGDVMFMPGSHCAKLEAIGFGFWRDPNELVAFQSLNANLELDEDTAAFGRRYPILENVRRLLLGSAPVHLKPDPSQPPAKSNYPHDPMSAIIQNKIKVSMDEGREIRKSGM